MLVNWSMASSSLRFFVHGRRCLGLVKDFEVDTFLDENCVSAVLDSSVGEQLMDKDLVDLLLVACGGSKDCDSPGSNDLCLPIIVSFLLLAGDNDLCL